MGFTTSFISGITVTSTTLYLSLLYHQRARLRQATLLHQQSLLLNSITDPHLASELATIQEENYSGGLREGVRDYRLQKAGLVERWKDVWNREVEGAVRWVQGVDWRRVREGVEGRARGVREGERRV
jgi:altered-inheritance-of-mitochondria protein 5